MIIVIYKISKWVHSRFTASPFLTKNSTKKKYFGTNFAFTLTTIHFIFVVNFVEYFGMFVWFLRGRYIMTFLITLRDSPNL